MGDTDTKPLDFPIVTGRGFAPGIDPASNASLLGFVDEADGVCERFLPGAAEAPEDGPPDRPRDD
jgi:hypothetical protein